MQRYLFILLFFVILFFPQPAHAIIILPALILIPVAKAVAIVIGALTLPSVGVGIVMRKLFNTPIKKVVMSILIVLMIIISLTVLFLKMIYPNRLW